MRVQLHGFKILKLEYGKSLYLSIFSFILISFRHGLPTRSRFISEFMIGLEKTKAKLGEVSRSARAIYYEDMIRLYHVCLKDKGLTQVQLKQGAVRYVSLYSFYMF